MNPMGLEKEKEALVAIETRLGFTGKWVQKKKKKLLCQIQLFWFPLLPSYPGPVSDWGTARSDLHKPRLGRVGVLQNTHLITIAQDKFPIKLLLI